MRAFVGLGEGIGNVVMGLPLLDAVQRGGAEVSLSLLPTPPEVEPDLAALVTAGRPWLSMCGVRDAVDPYDVAYLTHWWVSRCGGRLPPAREVRVGGGPSADHPEIDANLDALGTGGSAPSRRAVLHVERKPRVDELRVVLHPGCKPEWRDRKVYPRWAEVTHRLKDLGAVVVVVGTEADDAYCGEPHLDLRGKTTLPVVASTIAHASAFVSGDSGLHHVAVALGVPAVALFGGSNVVKATHPDPRVAPVVFASERWEQDPREVAAAVMASAVTARSAA